MRVKRFRVEIALNNRALRDNPALIGEMHLNVVRRLSERVFLGPRGGAYIPFGDIDIASSDQQGDAWMRNEIVFRGSRNGRYVRPHAIPLTDPPHGD